jgi:DNA-binding CsgD family transcriptional regulator
VLEELANFAYLVGDVEQAFGAIGRARAIHEAEGDDEAVGRCARVLSRLHWFAGDGAAARDNAREAVAILEPLGESSELARAYSGLSQLAMLDEDAPAALDWAERSLALAERLGDDATRIHALVNVGATKVALDPHDVEPLHAVHSEAAAAGDTHEAVRALLNAAYFELFWLRPETAVGLADEARAYARENDLDWFISYAEMTRAWLAVRAGDWEAAELAIRRKPVAQQAVWNILGDTVAAELAVRRGDDDAPELLGRVAALAYRTGELQRIGPILELETVAAICGDGLPPVERFEALVGAIEYRGEAAGPCAARIAAWAAVVGVHIPLPRQLPAPYEAMLDGDWGRAADAFGAIGWTFDRAFFLSFLDDEDALGEAIGIARALGAAPLTRHVARRMRTLGLKVPRGPREATRTNPLGLTPRQLEVLELIAAGRTNAEIADHLVVSTRTAEHHVAAVLTKLGATTRHEAARRAQQL